MTRSVVFMSCVFALCLHATATADEKPQFTGRTDPLQAMRALPGVFHIYMVGDVDIHPPKSVELRLNELDEQFQQAQTAGEIPREMTASMFRWITLALEPKKYLLPLESGEVIRLKDRHVGSGTGFAISRNGIVLTNRHVVENQENKPLSPENLNGLNPACLSDLRIALLKSLGPWEGDSGLGAWVETQILAWLGEHCRMTARFDQAIVAVAYVDPKVTAPDAVELAAGLFGLTTDRREPILVPAKILAKGAPGFPTDVAILKIEANVLDALVCLPLGKPGLARETDKILSLGFPGYRYDEATMSLAELSMVSVNPGMIHWIPNSKSTNLAQRIKPKLKDLDEIEQQLIAVTAIIRPGSSGGPLILEDGTVVGLNVAVRRQYDPLWNRALVSGKTAPKSLFQTRNPEGNPQSLDLAVPIEVAFKMLAEQNITPDPGPTTKLWRDGMDLYDAGKHTEALAKFEQVAAKQIMSPAIGKPYEAKKQPIRIVSHYVQEMIEACRKKRN